MLGQALGCNAIAGIEEGVLALCQDGTRIDQTGCRGSDEGNGGGGAGGGSSCRSCPDPDPDECPLPWQWKSPTTGSCYLHHGTERDWNTAREHCLELGGDLAALSSAEEFWFIGSVVSGDVWIGGTDAQQEGEFSWSNGEPWVFTAWKEGVPGDQGSKQDCVMLSASPGTAASFDDRACGEKRGFLCEKSKAP
ncbi:C-type lectin domain-containing protein [Polyangium jinanense]|uniref:C-type lectin domain-containing protein n=1 Tax=Polyangium jinanense TaxID=2829994 RepID=A0A9X3X7Q3_9BACT|nr:C-type lectin domain-containing protein [Polyangium jinanense]MDC3956108.1 C-type lectin domain-containing protein [Polyangium jinanense]MDC3982861.1 C-type lectin domain-containing protein [Polyangium jinanense]